MTPRPPNASRVKALHSPADSAPQAHPTEAQFAQSPAPADPITTKSTPRVINVAKNAASPKAIAQLKASGILPEALELRQVNYLNNLIEQDHRFIKRLVKPGLGFFSFESAERTLHGYEAMHMIRKGQMHGVNKGDLTGQVSFIARLFGMAASAEQKVGLHAPHIPPRVFATQPSEEMSAAKLQAPLSL